MFEQSADLYDAIYLQWKDYAGEAAKLRDLIRERTPEARRILDVACGTGEHIRHLNELGFEVDGVDVDPEFVEIAASKNPSSSIHCMDMLELALGVEYHVVMCLFSSIGYVRTEGNLRKAVARLGAHTLHGGLVLIEPWLEPGVVEAGRVHLQTISGENLTGCRLGHTSLGGGVSVLRFEYLLGTREGIERRSEVHELGLFDSETMTRAMEDAGLSVEHDPDGPMGRGLYVGTKQECS